MEIITNWLHQGFMVIIPFVILLGILIFVHELGHFLVAKYFGVRVEVFSLGFGKKILQIKRGHTIYCISIIPLGGYVKMFGDDPAAEIKEEDKAESFLHKPVGPRIAVVLAGPIMNLIFAMFLFGAISMVGEDFKGPYLGDLSLQTVASKSGFRSGDKILKVNQVPIRYWNEIYTNIKSEANKEVSFLVEREFSGEQVLVNAPISINKNPNVLSLDEYIGDVDGFTMMSKASVVGVFNQESLAYKSGLRTGDLITEINSQKTRYWREIEHWIGLVSKKILIKAERFSEDKKSSETVTVEISPEGLPEQSRERMTFLGLESPDLHIEKVLENSPALAAGILSGDRLVQIDGKKLDSWDQVVEIVKSFVQGQKPLEIELIRNKENLKVQVAPVLTSQMNASGLEDKRFTIGIVPVLQKALPHNVTIKAESFWVGTKRGVEKSWDVTVMTVMSFVKLIQNKISPKNIGGVISIGQVASETFKVGLSQFFQMMGVISINLFVLNLLPIPILDGGHLLFYTVEAMRGSPLSMRKMEIAQTVGLVLLMGLMVFALFNDFARIFNW